MEAAEERLITGELIIYWPDGTSDVVGLPPDVARRLDNGGDGSVYPDEATWPPRSLCLTTTRQPSGCGYSFGYDKTTHDNGEALSAARQVLTGWAGKQGHERCWWHPEILEELCGILGVDVGHTTPLLPSRDEFELGCKRFQDGQYSPGRVKPEGAD